MIENPTPKRQLNELGILPIHVVSSWHMLNWIVGDNASRLGLEKCRILFHVSHSTASGTAADSALPALFQVASVGNHRPQVHYHIELTQENSELAS
jgi:hypothetical protein